MEVQNYHYHHVRVRVMSTLKKITGFRQKDVKPILTIPSNIKYILVSTEYHPEDILSLSMHTSVSIV